MKFIKTIRDSVYGPSFYQSLNSVTVGKSIRYFLLVSLILGFISAIPMVPDIFAFFSSTTVNNIVQTYPADLEINIRDGKVSTNQTEPYYLKDTLSSGKDNLLVIDTKTPLTGTQFADYSTYVLLKQDYAIVANNQGDKIISLSTVKDFTLTQTAIASVAEQIYPYLTTIAIVASILFWLVMFVANACTLIYVLIAALLVLWLTKIMKRGLSYKESYKTAVYAATLPIIVSTLLGLFGVGMPFLTYSLLLLIVVYINLRNGPSVTIQPSAPVPSAPQVVQTVAPSATLSTPPVEGTVAQ